MKKKHWIITVVTIIIILFIVEQIRVKNNFGSGKTNTTKVVPVK